MVARILSVVQAIQPVPGSSRPSVRTVSSEVALRFEALRSSSRRGISWTPMEKRGRSLCGGAVGSSRSLTARGMFESTDMLYTV